MKFSEEIKKFRDVVLGRDRSPEKISKFQDLIRKRRQGLFSRCKYCGKPLERWMTRFYSRRRREFCNLQHSNIFKRHGPMVGKISMISMMLFLLTAAVPKYSPRQQTAHPKALVYFYTMRDSWQPSNPPGLTFRVYSNTNLSTPWTSWPLVQTTTNTHYSFNPDYDCRFFVVTVTNH